MTIWEESRLQRSDRVLKWPPEKSPECKDPIAIDVRYVVPYAHISYVALPYPLYISAGRLLHLHPEKAPFPADIGSWCLLVTQPKIDRTCTCVAVDLSASWLFMSWLQGRGTCHCPRYIVTRVLSQDPLQLICKRCISNCCRTRYVIFWQ